MIKDTMHISPAAVTVSPPKEGGRFSTSGTWNTYVINPEPIYSVLHEVLFDSSGTFNLPSCESYAWLQGGMLRSYYEPCDSLDCIGANDSVEILINGQKALLTSPYPPVVEQILVSIYPQPLPGAHPGLNTWDVKAYNRYAYPEGVLTPLKIVVYTPDPVPTSLNLNAPQEVAFLESETITAALVNSDGEHICYPPEFQFTLEIVSGQEWGTLVNAYGERGDTIQMSPPPANGYTYASFRALEQPPERPERVVIRLSCNDQRFSSVTHELYVTPNDYDLQFSVCPKPVVYGDTATIKVWRRLSDGTLVPAPQGYEFEYELSFGDDAGYLLSPDGTEQGWFIMGAFDSIRFVAEELLPQPDAELTLVDVWACDPVTYDCLYGAAAIVVEKPSCPLVTFSRDTIGLGDTTDFVVRKKTFSGDTVTYRSDQRYDVSFADPSDEVFGRLLNPCTQALEQSLECVTQGFKFVAAKGIVPSDGHAIKFLGAPVAGCGLCPSCGSAGAASPSTSIASFEQDTKVSAKVIQMESSLPVTKSARQNSTQGITNGSCTPGGGVVVQCEFGKDSRAITEVKTDMFQITQENNNQEHCSGHGEGNTFLAGRTWHSATDFDYGVTNMMPFVSRLTFPLFYGVCYLNIPPYVVYDGIQHDIIQVEQDLSTITNIFRAKEAVQEFKRITIDGGHSPTYTYYPILQVVCHELGHVGEDITILQAEFNKALSVINSIQPPKDYCTLPPETQRILYEERMNLIIDELNRAQQRAEAKIAQTAEVTENALGYFCVKDLLIPSIKQRFNIP